MKKKDICPECSTYTLRIKPKTISIVWDEQTRLKKEKAPQHKRTIEFLVNRIISEWGGTENNGVVTKTLSFTGVGLTMFSDIIARHKHSTGETLSLQQAFNYIMNDYNNLRNQK